MKTNLDLYQAFNPIPDGVLKTRISWKRGGHLLYFKNLQKKIAKFTKIDFFCKIQLYSKNFCKKLSKN